MQNDSSDFIHHFEQALKNNTENIAMVYRGQSFSYEELGDLYQANLKKLSAYNVGPSSIVVLIGDFDPVTVSLMMALIKIQAIIVPLLRSHTEAYIAEASQLAAADIKIRVDTELEIHLQKLPSCVKNSLILDLNQVEAPGLILLSSGSTGKPKAALHNFSKLLTKFIIPAHHQTMINFLMFDHWGGLNTLFYILDFLYYIIIS